MAAQAFTYESQLQHDDRLVMGCRCSRIGRKSLEAHLRVMRGDERSGYGTSALVAFDYAANESTKSPPNGAHASPPTSESHRPDVTLSLSKGRHVTAIAPRQRVVTLSLSRRHVTAIARATRRPELVEGRRQHGDRRVGPTATVVDPRRAQGRQAHGAAILRRAQDDTDFCALVRYELGEAMDLRTFVPPAPTGNDTLSP